MKFIYFYLFLLFSACNFPTNDESNAVARVGENYLFLSDLQDQIGPRYNGDSLQIANRLINDWAEQLLYLKKAEINLSSTEKNVSTNWLGHIVMICMLRHIKIKQSSHSWTL